ncbi:hypothetical protein [Novosphingobium sediminicola]|uniref:Putative membrane protein n=1 Tax=Novosphingobium sediminicola TaxID=563162 RepID=A0A7W6CJ85_9SPHN|nr:hypothetical protein [Novosphingobium sediminicola]MBB3957494.1 putative membrane protein [Novosphingobium sediminicola]
METNLGQDDRYRKPVAGRIVIGHLALLLIATGVSVVLASLLLTEKALPLRTTASFAVLLMINLSWTAYATWVLTARRRMLLNHRVVAGWIAMAAAAVFTVGTLIIGATTRTAAAYPAAGAGLIFLLIAITLLVRATLDFRALQMRRAEIEARLGEMAG